MELTPEQEERFRDWGECFAELGERIAKAGQVMAADPSDAIHLAPELMTIALDLNVAQRTLNWLIPIYTGDRLDYLEMLKAERPS